MINPVIADLLPSSVEFVSWTPTLCNTDGYTLLRTDNHNGTGRTLLRITYSGNVPPDNTCGGDVRVRVRTGTPPGTVANSMYLIDFDNPEIDTDRCKTLDGDLDDVDGDGDTTEILCGSRASFTVISRPPPPVVVHKTANTSQTSGILGADRLITYTLAVTNTGSGQLANLTLSDTLPSGTACVACSPTSQITQGISTTLVWSISRLEVQRVFSATFVISATTCTFSIENQAYVFGGTLTGTVRSNRVNTPCDPNAIDLTDFSITPSLNPVTGRPILVVRWTTGAEIDTYGFHLLRSTDGSRDNAVRITPGTILRQGQGTLGASYEWSDNDVQPGVTYTYWLQETELSGTVNVYALTSGRISPDWRLRRCYLPTVRLER